MAGIDHCGKNHDFARGMYMNSESGDAEWITMLQVVCCKGSIDYMEFGMDRCDLDDWQGGINLSLNFNDYICRQPASRHPTSSDGLTQARATLLE